MPPAASAAAPNGNDDDDGSPPVFDPISNSNKGSKEIEELADGKVFGDGVYDDDDYEIEYEEVEEEIEVEEIEEIEVEEEEEEEEEEEDAVHLPEEVEEEEEEEDAEEKCKDVSQSVNFEQIDGLQESHFIPEKRLLSKDSVCKLEFSGPNQLLVMQKEQSCLNREESDYPKLRAAEDGGLGFADKKDAEPPLKKKKFGECSEPNSDSNACLFGSENMAAKATNSSSMTGKECVSGLAVGDCLGKKADGVLDFREVIKPMDGQLDDANEQSASRLGASAIGSRSLSHSAEFKDGNKHPAVVCDFFARGWCIRGRSCTFLHLSDKEDETNQHKDDKAANLTQKNLNDEGLRNSIEIPKLPSFPDPMVCSIGKTAVLSFCSENAETGRQNQFASDSGGYTSAIDRYGSPSFHNSMLPKQLPSIGLGVTSRDYHSGNPSSNLSSLNDYACIRGQNIRDSSLSTSDALQPHLVSAWSSVSFSSSLMNPSGPKRLLDTDRDYHASKSSSLHQSASSDQENLCPANIFENPSCQAESKAKVSSDDWEPSVPFQPSFFITPTIISSTGMPYDPLRDCIDSPSVREPFKFSFFGQGTSAVNTRHQPKSGNSFHHTPTRTVTGETFEVNGQKEIICKEENASDSSQGKADFNKINVDCNSSHQGDGSRYKKDPKLETVGQTSEMEVDQKIDGNMQKESKALRQFRAYLIDFVKELVKPTWHKGHLSKDAHNRIVKKAVEKVLGTLQTHQTPMTMESIKQYLSFSQPKIVKLVEAYVAKYGKS